MPSFLSLFRRKENRKEAKEREKPNPFIMKKKQGYALGSLLLGAASWLCLWGLQHIERRMKKKQEK